MLLFHSRPGLTLSILSAGLIGRTDVLLVRHAAEGIAPVNEVPPLLHDTLN